MKKILIILIFLTLLIFAGCSENSDLRENTENLNNETNNDIKQNSIDDYILLDNNIPSGYILAPMSNSDSSITKILSANPGKIKTEYAEMLEKEMGLDGVDYVTAIYIHEESQREVSLMIIDPTQSSSFETPGSTTTTTILETKEGFVITIGDLIVAREDFTNKLQGLFNEVSKKEYSAKDDNLLPNKVEMTHNLVGNPAKSTFDGNNLNIVFTYSGAQKRSISYNEETNIKTDLGSCSAVNIKNVDTADEGNNINFLNGQTGYIVFDCDEAIENDKFIDSSFKVLQTDSRTGISTPSDVIVRLNWN